LDVARESDMGISDCGGNSVVEISWVRVLGELKFIAGGFVVSGLAISLLVGNGNREPTVQSTNRRHPSGGCTI